MSRSPFFLAIAMLLAGTGSASAAIFEFSYTYSAAGGSHVMQGTMSGLRSDNGSPLDLTDDYLTTPTVLSASFDGSPMISTPLVLRTYDDTGFHDSPVDDTNVYFAAASNNFIISPCATTACVLSAYADSALDIDVFFMRALSGPGVQYYSELSPLVAYNDTSSSAGTWLLREVVSGAIPEPTSYALCAIGLMALVATGSRRRRERA